MNVTRKIQNQVNKFVEGTPFNYEQLTVEPQEFVAAAKAIERLIADDVIKRISPGIFYKPKKTIFGELPPDYSALLKKLYLFKGGKRVGYITGTALYNELNLTTQLSSITKIATNKRKNKVTLGWENVTFTKAYTEITEDNYKLLGLLDALKDLDKIPDLDKKSAIKILSTHLNSLDNIEVDLIISCALQYPPRVRAFLGAILEKINNKHNLKVLKESLNPFSKYNYGIRSLMPNAENWNIE